MPDGSHARRDRRVRRRGGRRRRGPLPPRGRRAPRPRPDAGGHPGPVRGLRGRRVDGGRRARPPRLHGRGADRRPAHPRGGARARCCCSARPPAATRRRPSSCSRCGSGWPRSGAAPWASTGRGSRSSSGPTRRTPPATGSPRWSSSPAASRCSATAGQKSTRIRWEDVHEARPDVVVVAPCGYDRAGAQAQADAVADLLPAGVRGARRRRRRDVGAPRPAADRRRRGAGLSPPRSLTACPAAAPG